MAKAPERTNNYFKKPVVEEQQEELIKRPTQRQELFVDFYIEHGVGVKAAELAGYKGDYRTLNNIATQNLQKPIIKQMIELKRKDLRKRFEEEANNAFIVMVGLMNNPKVSPRTRLDACKDVLDRAGYKPSDKVELTGANGNPVQYETRLTREISARAKRLMLESVNENDIPIEIGESSLLDVIVTDVDDDNDFENEDV